MSTSTRRGSSKWTSTSGNMFVGRAIRAWREVTGQAGRRLNSASWRAREGVDHWHDPRQVTRKLCETANKTTPMFKSPTPRVHLPLTVNYWQTSN